MALFTHQRFVTNPWVQRNQIPLGVSENDALVWKILPRISDSMIIASVPGVGKSVLFRLLYYYISKIRPILVIDWEGEDHKHSKNPNRKPTNLPPEQMAEAIHNSVFLNYTPNKENYERRVVPNLLNYSANDLRGLGLPMGGAMELRRVLRDYGPFKTIKDVLDFVRAFPTNTMESRRLNSMKNCPYKKDDTIAAQSKQSITKYLFDIDDQELFALDDKNYPSIVQMLIQGKNVFLNFYGQIDMCRIEVTKIIKELIEYRKSDPDGVSPAIFYEEADRIIPRNFYDPEEHKKTLYILNVLVEAAKRARKHRIAQYFATPALSNLNNTICEISNEAIFGKMKGYDIAEAARIAGSDVVYMINRLKFNRYRGLREFIFMNEFGMLFKFIPYECPQDYHREY